MNYDNALSAYAQAKYCLISSDVGASLSAKIRIFSGKHNGGKRGYVVGFSAASARRLRKLLFSLDYREAVSVTLTSPLYFFDPEKAFMSLHYDKGARSLVRCLIWRKEVQLSGTPHYHCILWPSDGLSGVECAERLIALWIRAVLRTSNLPSGVISELSGFYIKEMESAHFDRRRPSIRRLGDGSQFVRYLLDHQSKHKIEQARTIGRAWGVWNRSKLPLSDIKCFDLTEEQYFVVGRVLRKASRYLFPAACIFGRKHSRGRYAHQNGVRHWFGRSSDGAFASAVLRWLEIWERQRNATGFASAGGSQAAPAMNLCKVERV